MDTYSISFSLFLSSLILAGCNPPSIIPGDNEIDIPPVKALTTKIEVSLDSPLIATVNRSNVDHVMSLVYQANGVDGTYYNSSLQEGTNTALTQDEVGELVHDKMHLDFGFLSFSDDGTNRCTSIDNNCTIDLSGISEKVDYYAGQSNTDILHHALAIDPFRHSSEKKVGFFLYTQKHYQLQGDVQNILEQQRNGLSVIQLTYGGSNESYNLTPAERLGYGFGEIPPDLNGNGVIDPNEGRLTNLGVAATSLAFSNGLLVDAAHMHDNSIQHIAELAIQNNKPFTVSHSLSESISPHFGDSRRRGVTDASLLKVAEAQGVVGVVPLKLFLLGEADACVDVDTLREITRHISYMVDTIDQSNIGRKGSEHIGLASDTYITGRPGHKWTACELNSETRWDQVLRSLAQKTDYLGNYKYSIRDLRNIYGQNFIRALKNSLPGYAMPNAPVIERQNVLYKTSKGLKTQYKIEWDHSQVTSSPNEGLEFNAENRRYEITLYANHSSAPHSPHYVKIFHKVQSSNQVILDKAVFTSTTPPLLPQPGPSPDLDNRVEPIELERKYYPNYRGFIKVFNEEDAKNQYSNSEWFYFSLID